MCRQGQTDPSRSADGDPPQRDPGVEQMLETGTCAAAEQRHQGCGGTEVGGNAG